MNKSTIYIADCDAAGGIYVYDFENGVLSQKQFAPLDRPMYLCIDKNRLYCIIREAFGVNSGIISYKIDQNGCLYEPSEVISTEGEVCCHLCVKDGSVFSANYRSGSVNLLGAVTVVHSGSSVHPVRQTASHTHFTNISPDGKYLLVCDLGLDAVVTYNLDLQEVSRAYVPAGHGARHLVYSEDGKTVYAVNELTSTISVFDYNDGVLEHIETVEGLPSEEFSGESYAAAIRRDGNLLYISQRGFNAISIFDISGKIPVYKTSFPSNGHYPRDFDIFGDYIIVTNEGGNASVFNKHTFQKTCEIPLHSPLCVI